MKGTTMLRNLGSGATMLVLAGLALSGCGSDSSSTYGDPAASSPAASSTASEGAVTLTTADTDLGTIITDGEGKTVYLFDKDEVGGDSSACVDECATMWPTVPGDDHAMLDGVTGEVGTIAGTNGEPQLTLNGHPLYYFVKDAKPGDVNGQGVMDIWWAIDTQGKPVMK